MAKVRVYELAKELGLESKELLQTLNDMGEFVRSASSTIEAAVVRRIRQKALESPGARRQSADTGRGPVISSAGASYDDRVVRLPAEAAQRPQPSGPPRTLSEAASILPGGARSTDSRPKVLTIAVDLLLKLYPVEIDAVEVSHSDHPEFRIRVDKLDDEKNPYWMSVWISDQALPIPGAWKRLRKWRLPLKPLDVPKRHLPGLGVLQVADEQTLGRSVETITSRMLGNDAEGVRLSAEECSQAEANRRYGVTVLVNRRRGNGARKRFVETTCLKCGLPLSDPISVKVGIGPECRRQMGQDAIRALSADAGSRRRIILGARKPATWVSVVQRRFAELRRRSSSPADPL